VPGRLMTAFEWTTTLILRSGVFAASRRMQAHRGLMVRDGARTPPHHEGPDWLMPAP